MLGPSLVAGQGWPAKRVELISRYSPLEPAVVGSGGGETLVVRKAWSPSGDSSVGGPCTPAL